MPDPQSTDNTGALDNGARDRASSSSAARRVATILRERILSGQYAPGEWLPAERDLTEELRVHRRIVRAAAVMLANEDLLVRRTNCRPVVNIPTGMQQLPQHVDATDIDALPDEEAVAFTPASRTVALLMCRGGGVFELEGTAHQRIDRGITARLADEGDNVERQTQFLDLEVIGSEAENAAREAFHISYALRRGYAGIVFYPYATESNIAIVRAAAKRVPFVLIDRRLAGVEADYVGIQNRAAIYDATKRLIDLGHKRIAFLTLPQNVNTVYDRQQGYIQAITEAFGGERQELILTTPDHDAKSWPVFNAVFQQPAGKRPTAAICVNDHIAVRATDHLDELGLRVPTDVSIMGFDNIVTKLPNGVALSTIAQPYEGIGRTAADLILRRLEKPLLEHVDIELPCTFVDRDSIRAI